MADLEESKQVVRIGMMQAAIKATYVEEMGDALVVADRQGIIVYFNPSAQSMFGYHSSQVIGQSIKFLIPERFHEAHDKHMETFWQNPRPKQMGPDRRIFILNVDQVEREATASITPMVLPEGRVAATAIRLLAMPKGKDSIGE